MLVPQEDALGSLPFCFLLFWHWFLPCASPSRWGWAGMLFSLLPFFPSLGAVPCLSCGKPSSTGEFSAHPLPSPKVFRADLGSTWCSLHSFHTRLQTMLSRFIVDIFCFIASVASQNFLFHLQMAVNTEPVTTSVAYPPWST